MIRVARLAAFTLISGGIALGGLAVAQSATASPLNIIDNGDGTATGYWQLPATGTWPQSAINPGALCGVVQADVYPYETAADKARTDALTADSTLTEGEDYGWPTSWTIKEYPACATTPSTAPSSTATPSPTATTGPSTPSTPITSSPSPSPTVSIPSTSPSPSATATPPTVPASSPTPSVKPESPATSPTPTVTSTSTSTPAAAVSNRNGTGTIAEPTSTSTELAYTGANTGPAIGGAVALLISGLVMLALGKKRKKA